MNRFEEIFFFFVEFLLNYSVNRKRKVEELVRIFGY